MTCGGTRQSTHWVWFPHVRAFLSARHVPSWLVCAPTDEQLSWHCLLAQPDEHGGYE